METEKKLPPADQITSISKTRFLLNIKKKHMLNCFQRVLFVFRIKKLTKAFYIVAQLETDTNACYNTYIANY